MENLIIKSNSPRYRSIPQVYKQIKQLDPDTAITLYFVRTLVKANPDLYMPNNTRALVNLDRVFEYLGYTA